jgi:hypothetical protein
MSNISNIIAAIPESDYPALLVDARAFEAATAALVAAANDEKPVDLSTATTPKNLGKVYADAVTFELGHDARVRHAATLAKIAVERTGMAEQQTASLAEPWFAEQFNAAAKRLVDVIAERGGGVDPTIIEHGSWQFDPELAELREALAAVTRWGTLRTDFTYRAGGGQVTDVPVSIPYERHSRTAILADNSVVQVLEHAANQYGWLEAGYWLSAVATTGVELAWQNSTQQHQQAAPAAVARERALMAAQFQEREDAVKARGTARRIA